MRNLVLFLLAMGSAFSACYGQDSVSLNNAARCQIWLGFGQYTTLRASTNSPGAVDDYERFWDAISNHHGLAVDLNYHITNSWFVTANGYLNRNRWGRRGNRNLNRAHVGLGGIIPLRFMPKIGGKDWLSVGGQWELGRIGGMAEFVPGDTWNHGGTVLLRLRISNSFDFTSKGSYYWNVEDDLRDSFIVPKRFRHIGVRAGITYVLKHKNE